MNEREVAINLIKVYVLRGDSLESLRKSYLGSCGGGNSASIGGYIFHDNEQIASEKISNDNILVDEVNGKKTCKIYKLKTIYDEIIQSQNQLSLFGGKK